MKIKLYNTLTRKKEEFKPIKSKNVGIYVCGPTVYNYAHIGNLSSFVFWDVLRRMFEYFDYNVNEVMNITDVDDKTIRDSQAKGVSLKEFTEDYTKKFFDDLQELNIQAVEKNPKASDHIDQMVNLVKKLLDKGIAYKAKDGIYFDIKKFNEYGKLADLDKDGLKVGASGRLSEDEYDKENASDFVLWKFWDEKDGDVFWETEIGKGRPGWHIECSAMSREYLGQPFDIHTGGIDLVFPHHENEIAQSEAAYDDKFVNYWLHNEHLLVNNSKMSKSKGNFYILSDITGKGFDSIAFRYMVLSSGYRKKMNFTWDSLKASQNALDKLEKYALEIKNDKGNVIESYKNEFKQVLSDDMDTVNAIRILWKLVKSEEKPADKYATLIDFDKVLGFGLDKLQQQEIPEELVKLAQEMDEARNKKQYDKADELRSQIESEGYKVENNSEGSRLVKI